MTSFLWCKVSTSMFLSDVPLITKKDLYKAKLRLPHFSSYSFTLLSCGKRRKWHFRDLKFKNVLENMPSDHLFWSAFRVPTFFPERTPSKSHATPLHWPRNDLLKMIKRSQKIECVKFTVNLTFQLKVTDSVALK